MPAPDTLSEPGMPASHLSAATCVSAMSFLSAPAPPTTSGVPGSHKPATPGVYSMRCVPALSSVRCMPDASVPGVRCVPGVPRVPRAQGVPGVPVAPVVLGGPGVPGAMGVPGVPDQPTQPGEPDETVETREPTLQAVKTMAAMECEVRRCEFGDGGKCNVRSLHSPAVKTS